MSQQPDQKKLPHDILNLVIMALAIVGGLATVLSCVIAFITLVAPNQVREIVVRVYTVQTPSPEVQVVQVTIPPPPPQPTYTPRPTYTPYPTYTPVPQATAIPFSSNTPTAPAQDTLVSLPFSDNFDSGVGNGWIPIGGDWEMANGQLVNRGGLGILWLGKASWTNIVVEFDSGSNYCGTPVYVLVRMQDPYNYIAVRIAGCAGEQGLYLFRDSQLKKTMADEAGRGNHWQIVISGNIYKLIIDGQLRASASDESFTSGSVGIQMGSAGIIDNFSVSPSSP